MIRSLTLDLRSLVLAASCHAQVRQALNIGKGLHYHALPPFGRALFTSYPGPRSAHSSSQATKGSIASACALGLRVPGVGKRTRMG
jgi:hypothetical protein